MKIIRASFCRFMPNSCLLLLFFPFQVKNKDRYFQSTFFLQVTNSQKVQYPLHPLLLLQLIQSKLFSIKLIHNKNLYSAGMRGILSLCILFWSLLQLLNMLNDFRFMGSNPTSNSEKRLTGKLIHRLMSTHDKI